MLRLRRSYRVAIVLFVISLLLAGGIGLYAYLPQPIQLTDTVGSASVKFEADDIRLFEETECYTVSWEVSGIEGVYLNENGKIGQGSELLCYEDVQLPQLRVVFQDESEQIYEIDVIVVQEMPQFWAGLGLAGAFLFFALYFFLVPLMGFTLRSNRGCVFTLLNLVALTLGTLVVVGVGLELGLRYYFANYGTEQDLIWYVYSSEDLQQRQGQLVGAPYTTYLLNPTYEGHTTFGYRGESVPVENQEDVFHIVAVGASTTYGFGLRFVEAYPFLLEHTLRSDFGYTNVEVTNAGIPGYTSYELLTNFQFRILEIEPDLVIYYGAKNDADTRFEDPGCYNEFSPLYGLTTFHGLWRTQFEELPSSVLYRYFAINAGFLEIPNDINFALEEIPIADECRAEETYTEEELLELNQPTFAGRNIRNFIALAQFHDIDVVMAELVHPTDPSHIYEDEDDLIMSPAKTQAVAEVNALYRQIADEMGVPYLQTSDDFTIEPGMFWTEVHMTFEGTKQLADIYAEFLIDNNLIPLPDTDQ